MYMKMNIEHGSITKQYIRPKNACQSSIGLVVPVLAFRAALSAIHTSLRLRTVSFVAEKRTAYCLRYNQARINKA